MKIKDYVDEKENKDVAEACFLAAYNLATVSSIYEKVNSRKSCVKEINCEKEH